MKLTSSCAIHLRDGYDALKRSASLFSDAATYLTHPILSHWSEIQEINGIQVRQRYVECLVHSANGRIAKYDFDQKFYKFPSYYLRAAITQALGIVSAYESQLLQCEKNGCKSNEPKMDVCSHRMPALYRGNTYKPIIDKETGEVNPYMAMIKVYRNNDWVWETVRLRKDVSTCT